MVSDHVKETVPTYMHTLQKSSLLVSD